MNQRLDFIEDLAEEVIVNQLPKERLSSSESKELKKGGRDETWETSNAGRLETCLNNHIASLQYFSIKLST